LTGDCGQFLKEDEEITAIVDLDIAHTGDIFEDPFCFHGRHPHAATSQRLAVLNYLYCLSCS